MMTKRSRPSRLRRLAIFAALAMLALQLQVVFTTPASASSACNGAFQGNPAGNLAISATVPNGGSISAGQSITVTTTWPPSDWNSLNAYYNCYAINGVLDGSLEYEEKPPTNDGNVTQTITVPNSVADGDDVCVRARLSGQPSSGNTSTQKSNELCWKVGGGGGNPDVKVTKSASKTNVNSGDSLTFTLEASNIGNDTANNVVITDTIPTGLQITGTSGGCSVSGQTVTCNVGDIAAGASKSVTIDVKATDGACPKVDNQATVSASNEPSANTGNNTSNTVTLNVTCPNPDVQVAKSSNAGATGVNPGDSYTYTITATNSGGATATNVKAHDSVPSGLTITGTSGSCSVSGQNVTCDLGDIVAGDHRSVSITVKATDAACPAVTNRATVSADNEPSSATGNNTSNDVTTLVNCTPPPPPEPGIAVHIVKTNDANRDGNYSDTEEAKRPDADVPFLLVITNTGEAAVRITDLTDSFDNTTMNLLTDKCPDLQGLTLQPGESTTCNFTLNSYSPAHASPLTNTAEVCVIEMNGNKIDCDRDPSTLKSVEVLGATITPTKAPPGGAAFTGSTGALGFGGIALGLLLLGSGLAWAGYRRRAAYDG